MLRVPISTIVGEAAELAPLPDLDVALLLAPFVLADPHTGRVLAR